MEVKHGCIFWISNSSYLFNAAIFYFHNFEGKSNNQTSRRDLFGFSTKDSALNNDETSSNNSIDGNIFFPNFDQELDSLRLDLTQNSSKKAHDKHWIKNYQKSLRSPNCDCTILFVEAAYPKNSMTPWFFETCPRLVPIGSLDAVCNVAILLAVETKSWY